MTPLAVIAALLRALRADAELMALLGTPDAIRRARDLAQIQTPLLTYAIISETHRENTFRLLLQWDVWAAGMAQSLAIEARLKAVLHSDWPRIVEGVGMWTLYQGGRDHPDPDPDIVHRSFDFLFEPVRER